MRGVVIVEGRDKPEGPVSVLLVKYLNGESETKGLIEVKEVQEDNDLRAEWLLAGILTPTGGSIVLALPWEVRFTAKQLEEVAVIGGDTQVFRMTLTPAQMAVMRYHFAITDSAMMSKSPPFDESLPGTPRTVLSGHFIPLRRLQQPGRLARLLGEEFAELVLREH